MILEQRYPELDALRGIAVLMMIGYHLAFDLSFFYGWDIPVHEKGWLILARGTAMMFLMVIGICFMISWERASRRSSACHAEELRAKREASRSTCAAPPQHDTLRSLYLKYLHRGFTIFTGGMLISLATWLVAPGVFVKFGILHLIGVSALLQPLFAHLKTWNILLGFMVTMIGIHLSTVHTTSFLLFPFGLPYPGFASLDYYPLFPWFGCILTGMGFGSILYIPKKHDILRTLDRIPYPQPLLLMGRQAFFLYFLHQPVLLTLLWLAHL
jgi:uncharacterized membrane protein